MARPTTTAPYNRRLVMVMILLVVSTLCSVASGWLSSRSSQTTTSYQHQHHQSLLTLRAAAEQEGASKESSRRQQGYDLGLGINKPVQPDNNDDNNDNDEPAPPAKVLSRQEASQNWFAPEPVEKPVVDAPNNIITPTKESSSSSSKTQKTVTEQDEEKVVVSTPPPGTKTTRRMVARDNDSQLLRGALWDEQHYGSDDDDSDNNNDGASLSSDNRLENAAASSSSSTSSSTAQQSLQLSQSQPMGSSNSPARPAVFYPDIDMSIPESVYSQDGTVDLVWDLLRWDAYQEAQREPLLVSFLYSTILNHASLESSLAFLLANRLQSPAMMISTQLQSLILDSLNKSETFRRSLRADIMAVRDRDPACNCLPDVFLYFKGFHALQSHRVAHCLWNGKKLVLAQFLQSQVSQIFQIDIHPNATMGSGIMLDHGTGIVIGETATVGHNCSILHHVTLGGSGKKGVVRHPSVGNGVLLGAGATVLGPVTIGDGSQVGAGTLVISDLPPHCVAVGVPARIIGSFVDVTEQPSIGMNQIMDDREKIVTFESDGI